jgi:hypothetical protein
MKLNEHLDIVMSWVGIVANATFAQHHTTIYSSDSLSKASTTSTARLAHEFFLPFSIITLLHR